jgi:hypothetical protein
MSGNKQANNNNQMIDTHMKADDQEHSNATSTNEDRSRQAEGAVGEDRSATQGSISGMANKDYSTNYTPDFSKSSAAYSGFLDNGGVDSGAMRVSHPMFQDQMNNQDIAKNYRADGTYAEFNKTGGVSDADKTNLRSRGTSVIPSFYSRMNDEGDRMASVQGGYNPGGMAMKARLARQQAGASQDAARDTELGISDQVRQGRQWGAQGMTGSEDAYQGQRFRAGSALDNSEARIQEDTQRGKMFGASGMFGIDNATNGINFDQATGNANRMFGRDSAVTGANQNLLNTDNSREQSAYDREQNERQIDNSASQGLINSRIQNNPRRDYLSPLIGGAAGVIGAAVR